MSDPVRIAAKLESVSEELKAVIGRVQATADDLARRLTGQSGAAFQTAVVRFNEAAVRVLRELEEISNRIQMAGIEYSRTEIDAASRLPMTVGQWDFAAVEAASSGIAAVVQITAALLDETREILAKLAPIWGGAGSDAYRQLQSRWDSTSAELNSALQNLAAALGNVVDAARRDERGIYGMFSIR